MPEDFRTSFLSTDDGEMYTTNTEREFNTRVVLSDNLAAAATRYYGFIDLSDTVNFPHTETGRIDLSAIATSVDKAPATRGSIGIGLITRIDTVSADLTFVTGFNFLNNDSSSETVLFNYAPSQTKCLVGPGGTTPFIKAIGATLTGVTDLKSNVPLSFGAIFTPAVGDLVVRVFNQNASSLIFGVTGFYHTHAL